MPGDPDSEAARLSQMGDWRAGNGVLLCLRGPVQQAQDTECDIEAQEWLAAHELPLQAHVLQAQRSGWRFPKPQAWVYAVYDVDAARR